MKKIIFFITVFILFISCHARKERTGISNSNNTDSIKNIPTQTDSINNRKVKREIVFNVMNTTKVTGEFERLDMELFHRCMEEGRANNWGYVYRKRLDSGIDIELDGRGRAEELIYQETHPDSYFSIYKIYDSRGYIKEKGLIITKATSLLSRMGTWYFYDESGKLINEINYEKPYTFTFNEVLAFCKKEGFPVTKGKDYPTKTIVIENETYTLNNYTDIDRGEKQKDFKYTNMYKDLKYWWVVTHIFNNYMTEIVLDGRTGKVLSRHSAVITSGSL